MKLRILCLVTVIALVAPRAMAQPAEGGSVAPDWTQALASVALINLTGPGGSPAWQTYGVVLGDPPRIVTRLSQLAGAEQGVATLRGGKKIGLSQIEAYDATQDVAVLIAGDELPAPPDPATAVRWRLNAVVFVMPGPGSEGVVTRQTVNEPFEYGPLRLVPLSGDLPAGLPVMDIQGKWVGLTGLLDDASGRFSYLTSSEQIIPIIFSPPNLIPMAGLAVETPPWRQPATPEGLLTRAVLRSFEKPADAASFFELAAQKDSTIADIYFWKGKSLFRQQNYLEAANAFDKCIALRPNWVMAYHMAGTCASQRAFYEKALEYYDRALALQPDFTLTLTNRAGAMYSLGRLQESTDILRRILEIEPTHTLAMYNLAATLKAMDRGAEAESVYTKLEPLDGYLAGQLRKLLDGGK